MSERSEQQYDEIIEKLNQLLEYNRILTQENAQKDDEIALLKEQIDYLKQKLFGSKKETLWILIKGIFLILNFLANQSKLETKAMK